MATSTNRDVRQASRNFRSRVLLMAGLMALGFGCADQKATVEADRKAGVEFLKKYESEGRDAAFQDDEIRSLLPQRIRNAQVREATFRPGTGATKLAGDVEAMDDEGHWQSGPFALFVSAGSVIAARFPGLDKSMPPPSQ